jgi:hypothetical protein
MRRDVLKRTFKYRRNLTISAALTTRRFCLSMLIVLVSIFGIDWALRDRR